VEKRFVFQSVENICDRSKQVNGVLFRLKVSLGL